MGLLNGRESTLSTAASQKDNVGPRDLCTIVLLAIHRVVQSVSSLENVLGRLVKCDSQGGERGKQSIECVDSKL